MSGWGIFWLVSGLIYVIGAVIGFLIFVIGARDWRFSANQVFKSNGDYVKSGIAAGVFWFWVLPYFGVYKTIRRHYSANPIIFATVTADQLGMWLTPRYGAAILIGNAIEHDRSKAKPHFTAEKPHYEAFFTPDGHVSPRTGTTGFGDLNLPILEKVPPVVCGLVTDSGLGYWLITALGEIFPFGDATHLQGIVYPKDVGVSWKTPGRDEPVLNKPQPMLVRQVAKSPEPAAPSLAMTSGT